MYVTSLFAVLPKDVSMDAIREVETLPRKYKVGAEDSGPGLSAQVKHTPVKVTVYYLCATTQEDAQGSKHHEVSLFRLIYLAKSVEDVWVKVRLILHAQKVLTAVQSSVCFSWNQRCSFMCKNAQLVSSHGKSRSKFQEFILKSMPL